MNEIWSWELCHCGQHKENFQHKENIVVSIKRTFNFQVAHCAVLVKMPDEDRQNSVETSFSELKSPTG